MNTKIFELIRAYEEQVDRLINNGLEPNELILEKIKELKEQRDRMMGE